MTDADMMAAIKALNDAKGALQIKKVIIQGDQVVSYQSGYKFSFKKWLKNIGRDEYGYFNFSFDLGLYPIFEAFLLRDQDVFMVLELAIINLNRDYLIADPDEGPAMKIRALDHSGIKFIEIS